MSRTNAPQAAHITGWDRTIVIALGSTGCALSYDALQQMAVAIHVRGFLTYLFPLVIDGFIAYGVRALLVLRNAPLRARLYLWMLFGTATAASIWANALHAVRLNDVADTGAGLRLGDTVVAVLSTIAPLALAGAVHLYILIARGANNDGDRQDHGQPAGHLGQVAHTEATGGGGRIGQVGQRQPRGAGRSVTALTDRCRPAPDNQPAGLRPLVEESGRARNKRPVDGHHRQPHERSAPTRQPNTSPVTAPSARTEPAPGPRDTDAPGDGQGARSGDVRRPDPDTEELLEIARSAVRAQDKLTRKVVAEAIRGQQIPLSNDTLTVLMAHLREQYGQPVTTTRD